jgi:excisionase family DNA binding protein
VDRLAYTPPELAEALGLSARTVYRHLASGTIPSVRVGGARRIPAAVVAELLEVAK